MTNEKKRLRGRIGKRILKDILLGVVISFLVCVALDQGYTLLGEQLKQAGHTLPTFDHQEIFFTELSIAFLVISFVTLLANKTETVYWVDVIQYRLVKPRHISIVDISSYIFANIVVSTLAYLVPALEGLLLFSFIIVILLLGLLSLKLLMAFFGIEDLKKELEKEYEQALDFRKTVVSLYYYRHDPDFSSFRSAGMPIYRDLAKKPGLTNKVAGLSCMASGFFGEYLPGVVEEFFHPTAVDRYEGLALGDFNSQAPIDHKDGSVEQIYENLMAGVGRRRVTSRHTARLYRKLQKYTKQFNGNVNVYVEMLDSLYTNTLNCIEAKEVKKSCEQIFFFFRHREYQRGVGCMLHALEHCPAVFVGEFQLLRGLELGDFHTLKLLNEMLNALRQKPEYSIYKDTPAINTVFRYMADEAGRWLCPKALERLSSQTTDRLLPQMLERQFDRALAEQDRAGMASVYRCLCHGRRREVVTRAFARALVSHREYIPYLGQVTRPQQVLEKLPADVYATISAYAKEKGKALFLVGEELAFDREAPDDTELLERVFEAGQTDAVGTLLQAYADWLEDLCVGFEFGTFLEHLDKDVEKAFRHYLAFSCDLAGAYKRLESLYRAERLEDVQFVQYLNVIGRCYGWLQQWLQDAGDTAWREGLDRQILLPCVAAFREMGGKTYGCDRLGKAGIFWKQVLGRLEQK